ncbi:hypothetical protein FHW96_004181 [Novosphingobium sp. SG751A]|uniref:nuclear transport factor 2 family protein n=1 Tax=Novosphingobium sp. SG751A TaxID=2587000 RepID=UPI001555FDFA|nr:nuclear transport factor 2 family protein [Novosphingobium sp. SG751A]NOW47997.1 hypothetical protein [Novosphingobium sp. SG751A]
MRHLAWRAAAFLPLLAITAPAPAAAPVEQTVLKIERQRLDATVARDLTALDRMTTADLNYVHAGGLRQNKAQYLAYIAKGEVTLASYDIGKESVRVIGDVAVTHGLYTFATNASSPPVRTGKTLFTAVYVRDHGQWRLQAWEATKVP